MSRHLSSARILQHIRKLDLPSPGHRLVQWKRKMCPSITSPHQHQPLPWRGPSIQCHYVLRWSHCCESLGAAGFTWWYGPEVVWAGGLSVPQWPRQRIGESLCIGWVYWGRGLVNSCSSEAKNWQIAVLKDGSTEAEDWQIAVLQDGAKRGHATQCPHWPKGDTIRRSVRHGAAGNNSNLDWLSDGILLVSFKLSREIPKVTRI
jgi:hypothetical protein